MSTKGTWTRSDEPGTETRFAAWIRLENDAMYDAADVAEAVERCIVAKLRQDPPDYDGVILDINGNTVGAWDIEAFQS